MFIFICLAVLVSETLAGNCGTGADWKYFPGTNSCYKLIPDSLPWTVAEFKCLFQGGHHVAIHGEDENQFVREVAQHREIWTGAAFFGSKASYVNSDQSSYGSFEHWTGGSRPTMNRARRCVKMDSNGRWFQSCCKKRTATVCKKAAVASYQSTNQVWRRMKFYRR